MISSEIKREITRLLAENSPFAAFRMPGEPPVLVTEGDGISFVATPWLGKPFDSDVIPDTTDRDTYLSRLSWLIGQLKQRVRSKTLLSRIFGAIYNNVKWADAAELLWDEFPEAFGFIFNSPSCGAWLGATPETLLKVGVDGRFSTQALAGTLPADMDWDEKNRLEQQIVADYIGNILKNKGIEFTTTGPDSVRFGSIKHLSTAFDGILPENVDIKALLGELAPTPALAGFPKDAALADISLLEQHNRGCYGGYVTVSSDKGSYSFVTIRCVQFDPRSGKAAVYAGGGITPDSVPEVEEKETRLKASRLMQILDSLN